MTKEELYEQLKPYGCKGVYVTGSTINPYIKNPRDYEVYAVFDTHEQCLKAPKIYNVFNVTKKYRTKYTYIWLYLHHFINNGDNYVGEKPDFAEVDIDELNGYGQILKEKKTRLTKYYYHVAMVEAIAKYGYDSIPESVAKQINDIHDNKISYDEFKLEGE